MYFDHKIMELVEGNPREDHWLAGQLKAQPDCVFFAKVYDRKSKFGLKGGRISKLEVFRQRDHWDRWPEQNQCHTVAHFDRGWDLKPNFFAFRDKQAIRLILKAFRNEINDIEF